MKKLLSVLLSIVMLVTCLAPSFSAFAAEAGTTKGNPIVLKNNTYHKKYWTNSNCDLNCFNKITIGKRGVVKLTITKPYDDEGEIGSFDLTLFDSNGKMVWTADTYPLEDSWSDNYVYKIGLKAGTYYLNIKAGFYVYRDSAPIPTSYKYNFTANQYCEIESNNSRATATELKLNNMYFAVFDDENVFNNSNAEDFFKFNLTAGKKYQLKIKNYDGLDASTTIMDLYDSNGNDVDFGYYGDPDRYSGSTAIFNIAPKKTGTYYFRLHNGGNREGVEFNIGVYSEPVSSSNLKINLSKTKFVYDGKAKKPTVTVKTKNGKTVAKSNYTVSYKNNTKAGKATVTIKFKGAYKGTRTATFDVVPKSTTISKLSAKSKGFKATWKKQATQSSGYQIRYSTSSSMSNSKTVTVSGSSKTYETIKGLKGGKKYYVQIRTYKSVNGKKYCGYWSEKKTVTTKR